MPHFHMDKSINLKCNDFEYEPTLQNAFDDCSALNVQAKSIPENKLAAFNAYMAKLRKEARSACPSTFHRFLRRALGEKRVVWCLTTSFDGLDEQPDPDYDGRIIRMYGDNRFLRCCMPSCPSLYCGDNMGIDEELIAGRTMYCPPCTEEARTIRSSRLAAQSTMRILRPAVDIHLPPDLHAGGDIRSDVIKAAESCYLLLIVGLPPRSGEIYDLMKAIGSEVHLRYGAVIYVDDQPIIGRSTDQCIDFHLQVSIEEFSTRVLAALDKVSHVFI
ncbi:hypothetical protein FRC11_008080 [Ceratobasidium sp. 423]|nr:hypothetical protein FRC11_008080 [Ceratobasidium sp. 423]